MTSLKNSDQFRQANNFSGSLASTINDDHSFYNKNKNSHIQEFGSIEFNSKINIQSMVSSIKHEIDK